MKRSKPYLRLHRNGVYYIHWTENRVGKRKTTKSRNRAEAEEHLRRFRGGINDENPRAGGGRAAPKVRPLDSIVQFDEAEINAMRADPVGYSRNRLVAARTKLSLLMLRYENAALGVSDFKLQMFRVHITVARAEVARQLSLYQDTKATAAGEPLTPPDCDSELWPRHRHCRDCGYRSRVSSPARAKEAAPAETPNGRQTRSKRWSDEE